MIGVRLKGGMGNQMFQYAFGLAMAERLQTEVRFDCGVLLDRARGADFVYRNYDLDVFTVEPNFLKSPGLLTSLFKIKSSTTSRWIKRWAQSGLPIRKEAHFHVEQTLLDNPQDSVLYDGWWQGASYFDAIEQQLRQAFLFRNELLQTSQTLYQQIKETNAVCLNVRRTDFLTTPALNATNLQYFERAAAEIAQHVNDPHFFIFSDDVEWCAQNIKLGFATQVVGHEHKGFKFGNYMQLMIACKHFIIPNSSFAWWAVWLNQNPDRKVVAPQNWFATGDHDTSDLVPKEWIRL